MKRYAWRLIPLFIALLPGCTDTPESNSVFFVSPSGYIAKSEQAGSEIYCFGAKIPTTSAVSVAVTPSEDNIVSLDHDTFQFEPAENGFFECVTVTCIDNTLADGDHRVSLQFHVTGGTNALDGDALTRDFVCRDDDNGDVDPDEPIPDTCTSGENFCVNSTQYKVCNADGTWNDALETCPTATPLCRDNTCQVAAECTPICSSSTEIQRCDVNGSLLDPESCGEESECRLIANQATCISTAEPSFTVSASSLEVYEGGYASFTIVPAVEPNSNVIVTPRVSDATQAEITTGSLSFQTSNWSTPQTVTIEGLREGKADGDQKLQITFSVTSSDLRYQDFEIPAVDVTAIDTEGATQVVTGLQQVPIRAVAANITSGNHQGYSPGHGVRIFKAIKPDIAMVQEFNWNNANDSDTVAMNLVHQAFGTEFYVHRGRSRISGQSTIPNGIISRYPIIDSGYWKSNKINNRDWDWALIDLPGAKELLVISVHLSTSENTSEVPSLVSQISSKVKTDSAKNLSYYLMIGGDFNKNYQNNGTLKNLFKVSSTLPKDQAGDSTTNAARKKTLDHLFVDSSFEKFQKPVVIGSRSYANGHVFDSRVYQKYGELDDVSPVLSGDSDAENMQHMAVIRDFVFAP